MGAGDMAHFVQARSGPGFDARLSVPSATRTPAASSSASG